MRRSPGPSSFQNAKAFTLVEVVVAIVIVGTVLTALIAAIDYGGRANFAAADLNRAALIARESREWTMALPFSDTDGSDADNPPGPDTYTGGVPFIDDFDDLMNATFQPPRDSRGDPMPGMSQWSQQFTLTWRDPADLDQTVSAGASDIVYVNLVLRYRGETVGTYGWLVTDFSNVEDGAEAD